MNDGGWCRLGGFMRDGCSWLFCLIALVSALMISCSTVTRSNPNDWSHARDMVPFAGLGRSPAGSGVDLSLHSGAVARNPLSNPNLAWDEPGVFTVMAHGTMSGFGPVLLDETGEGVRMLTPERLMRRIGGNNDLKRRFNESGAIVLYACGSGRETPEGYPSFARRLARLTGKPVVAPNSKLWMNRGAGYVGDGGVFKVEAPNVLNSYSK